MTYLKPNFREGWTCDRDKSTLSFGEQVYTQHRIIHYIETLQKPTVNIVLEGFPIATLPALIMYICVFEIGVYQFMAIEWGKQCLVMFLGPYLQTKPYFRQPGFNPSFKGDPFLHLQRTAAACVFSKRLLRLYVELICVQTSQMVFGAPQKVSSRKSAVRRHFFWLNTYQNCADQRYH
jgi:hypothetical protein